MNKSDTCLITHQESINIRQLSRYEYTYLYIPVYHIIAIKLYHKLINNITRVYSHLFKIALQTMANQCGYSVRSLNNNCSQSMLM